MVKRAALFALFLSTTPVMAGSVSCTSFTNMLLKAERLGDVEKPGPNVRPPVDDHYFRLMDRTNLADPIRYFQIEHRAGRIYRGKGGSSKVEWTVDLRSTEKGNPILRQFVFRREDGKCLLQKMAGPDWSFDQATCQAFQADIPKIKEAMAAAKRPKRRAKAAETPEPVYEVTDKDQAGLELCQPQYTQYFAPPSPSSPPLGGVAKSVE